MPRRCRACAREAGTKYSWFLGIRDPLRRIETPSDDLKYFHPRWRRPIVELTVDKRGVREECGRQNIGCFCVARCRLAPAAVIAGNECGKIRRIVDQRVRDARLRLKRR